MIIASKQTSHDSQDPGLINYDSNDCLATTISEILRGLAECGNDVDQVKWQLPNASHIPGDLDARCIAFASIIAAICASCRNIQVFEIVSSCSDVLALAQMPMTNITGGCRVTGVRSDVREVIVLSSDKTIINQNIPDFKGIGTATFADGNDMQGLCFTLGPGRHTESIYMWRGAGLSLDVDVAPGVSSVEVGPFSRVTLIGYGDKPRVFDNTHSHVSMRFNLNNLASVELVGPNIVSSDAKRQTTGTASYNLSVGDYPIKEIILGSDTIVELYSANNCRGEVNKFTNDTPHIQRYTINNGYPASMRLASLFTCIDESARCFEIEAVTPKLYGSISGVPLYRPEHTGPFHGCKVTVAPCCEVTLHGANRAHYRNPQASGPDLSFDVDFDDNKVTTITTRELVYDLELLKVKLVAEGVCSTPHVVALPHALRRATLVTTIYAPQDSGKSTLFRAFGVPFMIDLDRHLVIKTFVDKTLLPETFRVATTLDMGRLHIYIDIGDGFVDTASNVEGKELLDIAFGYSPSDYPRQSCEYKDLSIYADALPKANLPVNCNFSALDTIFEVKNECEGAIETECVHIAPVSRLKITFSGLVSDDLRVVAYDRGGCNVIGKDVILGGCNAWIKDTPVNWISYEFTRVTCIARVKVKGSLEGSIVSLLDARDHEMWSSGLVEVALNEHVFDMGH